MTVDPANHGVTLREYLERRLDSDLNRVENLLTQRIAQRDQALALQAKEYERRLEALNHAHEEAQRVQHTYVTQEKYDDKLTGEALARETALLRVDEKFEDYVKRYEQRQREVDLLLQASNAAQAESTRVAERAAQATKDASAEAIRKSNRNIAAVGVILTAIIVGMNLIGVV